MKKDIPSSNLYLTRVTNQNFRNSSESEHTRFNPQSM